MRGKGIAVNLGPARFEKPREEQSEIYLKTVFTILVKKLSSKV